VGSDLAGRHQSHAWPRRQHVHLTVRRPGRSELLNFSVRRAKVDVRSVAQQNLEPGYGYVRITGFSETTADDVAHALARLKRDNPHGLKGLVIDLRNNPGGVLEASVAVADAFLDHGLIVSADGRTADSQFRMDATPGISSTGHPSSCSSMAARPRLQKYWRGRSKTMAEPSSWATRPTAKDRCKTVMPLSHGGALKLTTSRYFTPSGVSIHEKGILPDVVVDGPEEPPADLDVASAVPLTTRDPEVRLALEELKAHARLAQKRVALATVQ